QQTYSPAWSVSSFAIQCVPSRDGPVLSTQASRRAPVPDPATDHRAGVGRVTVYRHFPDEPSLARACSGQYFKRHPFPDPDRWRVVTDPIERLRTGLREAYAYHRATQPMISHVLADARHHPVLTPYHDHRRPATEALADPGLLHGP